MREDKNRWGDDDCGPCMWGMSTDGRSPDLSGDRSQVQDCALGSGFPVVLHRGFRGLWALLVIPEKILAESGHSSETLTSWGEGQQTPAL